MTSLKDFNRCIRSAETMGQLENPPEEGRELEVTYGGDTYDNVFFSGGKFVNTYGVELFNIIGWRYK